LRTITDILALMVIAFAFDLPAYPQVSFERLRNASKEPQNWLMYSGDYAGRRFSGLDQVNRNNARALVTKWAYQTAATGKLETTPLVVDGAVSPNHVLAQSRRRHQSVP